MTITELMTREPGVCAPTDSLPAAARIMWERDCGVVPVIDDGLVVGVITDRDLCMAAYLRGQPLHDCRVSDVMSRPAIVCREQDATDVALNAMREHQVRRLPVVDDQGHLVGIVSLNDLALAASNASAQRHGMRPEAVGATLTAISQHRTPATQAA